MELSQAHKDIYHGQVCPYCKRSTRKVTGDKIYGERGKDWGLFRVCFPCKAWVGCHKGTGIALGRLADYNLRALKRRAHAEFDPLWKEKYFSSRKAAYHWLSTQLEIRQAATHIGWFGIENCKKVIEVCKKYRDEKSKSSNSSK